MTVESDIALPRLSFFGLFWGMIRHPSTALAYLRDFGGRSWIILMVLAIVLATLPIIVSAPITTRQAQEAIQAQLATMPEGASQEASPEVQQRISSIAANPLFTVIFPSALRIFTLIAGWLIWAGALHLLSVMAGGDSHFSRMWRGVMWSYVPLMLRDLLQTISIQVTGEVIANPGLSGLVADNRSVAQIVAAPPSPGRLAISAVLAQVDLFTIWNLALLAVSVMVMARVSGRKAALITFAVWAVLMLVRILFAILPALFVRSF